MADLGKYELPRCCVCHQIFGMDEVVHLGGRPFCERHHALAMRATEPSLARAGLIETLLLAGFVGVVAMIAGDRWIPTESFLGVLIALVPSLLFLVFIYRQDRIEPEPPGLVLGTFVLGGLLGAAVVNPIVDSLGATDAWRHATSFASFMGAIGVGGTAAMLCTYLAVRYGVYMTDEFDEPVDGVVYACAASLGIATASNFHFLEHYESLVPLAAASTVAAKTFAHVGAGAILGFGIGHLRFDREEGQTLLAISFGLAAIAFGVIHELMVLTGVATLEFYPGFSFVLTTALALVVLVGTHVVTMRFARAHLEESEGVDVPKAPQNVPHQEHVDTKSPPKMPKIQVGGELDLRSKAEDAPPEDAPTAAAKSEEE